MEFDSELRHRLERLLQARVTRLSKVAAGYTAAARRIVHLEDGRTMFLKAATDEMTSDFLRAEYRIYDQVHEAFMPKVIAYDDGVLPILLLEDLSTAQWPPPWRSDHIETALTAVARVHALGPDVPRFLDLHGDLTEACWKNVERDPEPFLKLDLVSEDWLERSLCVLVEAQCSVDLSGESLLHLDLRSDNMCFRTSGDVILIDWNYACLGNPDVDLGFWLPSLKAEGGPEPGEVMKGAGGVAALVCGYFASRAGLPPIPHAPVRELQKQQAEAALPWLTNELGLEPVGGKDGQVRGG